MEGEHPTIELANFDAEIVGRAAVSWADLLLAIVDDRDSMAIDEITDHCGRDLREMPTDAQNESDYPTSGEH